MTETTDSTKLAAEINTAINRARQEMRNRGLTPEGTLTCLIRYAGGVTKRLTYDVRESAIEKTLIHCKLAHHVGEDDHVEHRWEARLPATRRVGT